MQARLSHQRYNTCTSTVVCFDYQGLIQQNGYTQDTLYLSKRGKYFLHRVQSIDFHKTETIVPFSENDAQIFINECAEQEAQWERDYIAQSRKCQM